MVDEKETSTPEETPAPVDVKSSVPLEVKIIDESIEALGGSTESVVPKPSLETVTTPTPVIIAAEQNPVPMLLENTADNPINVTTDKPLPVIMQGSAATPPRPDVIKGEGVTLAPTTTEQDDLVTEGQRTINLIWEHTQSKIALIVVFASVLLNCVIVIMVVFLDKKVDVTQLALISICLQFINLTCGVIIGFYFSRTNHAQKGGVGQPPQIGAYTGR